jgi:Tfp pilus assembly protein PilE
MRKLVAIVAILSLIVLPSCKTKFIETVRYEIVETHDTIDRVKVQRDSIMLHDSVYIYQKGDTVFSEKWRTEFRWRTQYDTVVKVSEIPHIVTDTVYHVKEVPVDKVVYKQHWWQRLASGAGIVAIIGLALAILFNTKIKPW